MVKKPVRRSVAKRTRAKTAAAKAPMAAAPDRLYPDNKDPFVAVAEQRNRIGALCKEVQDLRKRLIYGSAPGVTSGQAEIPSFWAAHFPQHTHYSPRVAAAASSTDTDEYTRDLRRLLEANEKRLQNIGYKLYPFASGPVGQVSAAIVSSGSEPTPGPKRTSVDVVLEVFSDVSNLRNRMLALRDHLMGAQPTSSGVEGGEKGTDFVGVLPMLERQGRTALDHLQQIRFMLSELESELQR